MIKKQMANTPWVLRLVWAFVLQFLWQAIVFWVECILGLDNGVTAALLHFPDERGRKNSQRMSDLRVILILFQKKSSHIYEFQKESWPLQYVEALLHFIRRVLAAFTVIGCQFFFMNYEFTWCESTSGQNSERLNLRWWSLACCWMSSHFGVQDITDICSFSKSFNRYFNSLFLVIGR